MDIYFQFCQVICVLRKNSREKDNYKSISENMKLGSEEKKFNSIKRGTFSQKCSLQYTITIQFKAIICIKYTHDYTALTFN